MGGNGVMGKAASLKNDRPYPAKSQVRAIMLREGLANVTVLQRSPIASMTLTL
jgi:hypothetical protein